MHRLALGLTTIGMLWGPGCSPSPGQLCNKFEKLEAKALAGPKTPDHIRKEHHATCVKEMARLKGNHPKAYKCVAQCSEQSHIDAAMLCSFGCMLKHTPPKEKLAQGGS